MTAAPGREDRARGALGPGHRGHHPRRHPVAASSRRPSRRRSPASTPSLSRCSSTATTAGASCRCSLHRVTKMVAMVMMLIGFSAAFGYMMAMMQVPAKATAVLPQHRRATNTSCLLMINVLLILLGTFMDMAPMILICTPILLPVILKFGIDPVHFGMILLLNLGHRPDHAAGRADAVRRLRDRQGDDGGGVARALAVLRRDVLGAARSSPTCRRSRSGCRTCSPSSGSAAARRRANSANQSTLSALAIASRLNTCSPARP